MWIAGTDVGKLSAPDDKLDMAGFFWCRNLCVVLGSSHLFDLICTPSDPPSIPRTRVEDIDGGS